MDSNCPGRSSWRRRPSLSLFLSFCFGEVGCAKLVQLGEKKVGEVSFRDQTSKLRDPLCLFGC
jgi:hypothetical protein